VDEARVSGSLLVPIVLPSHATSIWLNVFCNLVPSICLWTPMVASRISLLLGSGECGVC